ncbi:Ppx/GppA family phosphatase [Sandaracinobacter neustonicus]|uniref:Ppx/GppA family phosphatase n=1 Tax=Sandaracinobacter neustonicus TaxID=1715348 RepID=A0A501XN85_9SPHN|nr:Ppx/GppA family phosphatase [Sandaracinobacter neustonicus]TPE62131.1 Ppx/GppA family phosphatase [Sandaracinobacter neustonicus]
MATVAVPQADVQLLNHASPRIAIVDIGSNSVRLVVYKGLTRTPAVLFNEKVMAGLGKGLSPGGMLSEEAMDVTLAALARFALLADSMGVDSLRAVATAAVRDAANGPAFVARIEQFTGLQVEIIDGETEARGAAYGVIAGIPQADGVVGDLGGGSLELVRISKGEVHERLSLPLGSLRLDAFRKKGRRELTQKISQGLKGLDWAALGKGKPFYAVGGSWRALTQLYMHQTDWPLPVTHHHVMPADAPDRLVRTLAHISVKSLKDVPNISSSRAPQLPGAAAMLSAVTKKLGSSCIISSAYGLREGLLYQALSPAARRQDPLLTAAREAADRMGRFSDGSDADVGEALLEFSDTLFPDEAPALRRIRHAACLLADSAWRAHPDMRAEDALDTALHGNWVSVDASERAMMAAALWTLNGGAMPGGDSDRLYLLASIEQLALARLWGLTLRLGQRLGGGAADGLRGSALVREPGWLALSLPRAAEALYAEPVQRRHRLLAQALGLEPKLRLN